MNLLRVENLTVDFQLTEGRVPAVRGVSFEISSGKILGCVGESGSGKSVTAQTIMGLTQAENVSISGEISFMDAPIVFSDKKAIRRLRGHEIAMIFQDPLSSLHPYYSVGSQIAESYLAHHKKSSKREAMQEALKAMIQVGIPEAESRLKDYPHQFSGGMRQRIMIAMALVNKPKLLIADEPTTALDVTVQAQILDLLTKLQKETGMAILLITHDFGVVREVCDDVIVMYAGRVVESGSADQIFANPSHPYTRGLLSSLVSGEDQERLTPIPGSPPVLSELSEGCSFAPRCSWAGLEGMPCFNREPELQIVEGRAASACFMDSDLREIFFVEEK